MKVSVNWIKQFTEIELDTDELVKKIGAQLGAVEAVIDVAKKYEGIYIVRVVSCEKHPDADKLYVCMIDDGGIVEDVARNESGYVQVVCGAKNVVEGMLAVWLPPGSVVPKSRETEPFTLEARRLRGVTSNGMLASSNELAIGDDHSGIVSVDVPADPGSDFAATYELDDIVLDIENKMFTHRPDCFGILGVAREVAGIQGNAFISPEWYKRSLDSSSTKEKKTELRVENYAPGMVPRFAAVALDGIEVKPSPLIIQTYLARIGIRPINNVVDATNYIMALTGQPLHAYDADKLERISGSKDLQLEARLSREGDELTLLDGKTINFKDESTILITSNDVPVGVGGIMGGLSTEVDESTTRIVLECANFDMYAIRRSSMKHGLFTDAVTRFNKGQSPHQIDKVLGEALSTFEYVSSARVASDIKDERSEYSDPVSVDVTPDFIEKRLGMRVSANEIRRLLTNVEFDVQARADSLRVTVPFWRTDISIAEDIVEEIGRLIGFDSLPNVLPLRSIEPIARNGLLDFQDSIRQVLSSAGANEVLTYSFVPGSLLDKVSQEKEKAIRITNALSPDLHYYRLSITPSLLAHVHANIKAGNGEFALYEIGKTHVRGVMNEEELVPAEHERIAFVYAADRKTWQQKRAGAAFFQARVYLDYLLSRLGVSYEVVRREDENVLENEEAWRQLAAPYQSDRSGLIRVGDTVIGIIGELKESVRSSLKVPSTSAGFELDTNVLCSVKRDFNYEPLPKFPKIYQDISLKLSTDTAFAQVDKVIKHTLDSQEDIRYSVHPVDIYQSTQDISSKHMTYRIAAWSERKTMTNKELSRTLDQIATAARSELSAERL